MLYTLGQAAKVSGRSKPTLARAIKSGKLKGEILPDGSYRIDPAELDRYRATLGNDNEPEAVPDTVTGGETPNNASLLQALLDVLRDEREREREQLEGTINDLREQTKAQAATIETQAAALAGMSAASARAISQAEELRHQLAAIEHRKEPEAPANDNPPRPWPSPLAYWLAGTVALLGVGLFMWEAWTRQALPAALLSLLPEIDIPQPPR